MRLFVALIACLFGTAFSVLPAHAQYFWQWDLPDARVYLPEPVDTSELLIADDFNQWIWGKSVRPTPRGAQASWESLYGIDRIKTIYSDVLGITITDQGAPAIYNLLKKAGDSGNNAVTTAKEKYMRVRPFARMNEHVSSEFDDETKLRANGSYPSGHTANGWSAALALAEAIPELQDTILKCGYDYGQSRVIVGAHWQSDVDAGRLAASACIARLHTSSTFRNDVAAARSEYLRLKGLSGDGADPGVPDCMKVIDQPVSLDSYRYYGDVARHWLGKSNRSGQRGQQALADADDSLAALLSGFSPSVGIDLSIEGTPDIANLLSVARQFLVAAADDAVSKAPFRARPYVQFGEPSYKPAIDEAGRQVSSFPGGPSLTGWGIALVLAEMVPDKQNAVLKRGYDYGYSQVILGTHFATDTQAGRLIAACAVVALHRLPNYRELLTKAKDEYKRVKEGTSVSAPFADPSPDDTVYTLSGVRHTSGSAPKGILVRNGKKVLN